MSSLARMRRVCAGASVAGVCWLLFGCTGGQQPPNYQVQMDGNSAHGKELIATYGCGACHIVPGIHAARGTVGPSLEHFSRHTLVAGELPNQPENLVSWIQDPVALEPQTAMPNLGVSNEQAHDMAAYLYTLR